MLFSTSEKKLTPVKYKNVMIRKTNIRWRFENFAFNGLNPSYEIPLQQEKFGLRTIVGLTMDEINEMPIQDRRYFTILHNEKVEREKQAMTGKQTLDGSIDDVKHMTQQANEAKNKK
jgi:hypothetical protein